MFQSDTDQVCSASSKTIIRDLLSV